MRLIWKLLRKHISVFELAVFFVANLIGMAVILAGIQIYSDLSPMLTGEKSLIGNDYMIISRPIERVGGETPKISEEEIEALRGEAFVENLGIFASSKFRVDGGIEFKGKQLSTMMFFESVPNEFIDVDSEEWNYEEGDNIVPIILPRNYLNLYNFGFSQTQGLPNITEEMIKRVEISLRIMGNGHTDYYSGYVVGFSDRLNTILVPMSFMTWANDYYSEDYSGDATRLILEVQNPSAPEVVEYMAEHNFVAEDKPSESNKALFLLQVCVAVIVCIGAVFSLLSIIILTLSIYLLLQKNVTKLENLVLIGYKPSYVAIPYILMTMILNVSIYLISIVLVSYGQGMYMGYIGKLFGVTLEASPATAIVAGLMLTAAITLFNFFIIYRKIAEISRKRC
ncbi:MAG: ABC transporter permease [Alistipes sp.]|nr:ABC transporter permease [Alistipes sp.]